MRWVFDELTQKGLRSYGMDSYVDRAFRIYKFDASESEGLTDYWLLAYGSRWWLEIPGWWLEIPVSDLMLELGEGLGYDEARERAVENLDRVREAREKDSRIADLGWGSVSWSTRRQETAERALAEIAEIHLDPSKSYEDKAHCVEGVLERAGVLQ